MKKYKFTILLLLTFVIAFPVITVKLVTAEQEKKARQEELAQVTDTEKEPAEAVAGKWCRETNSRYEHPILTDAFRCFFHFFIVQYTERMISKLMQIRELGSDNLLFRNAARPTGNHRSTRRPATVPARTRCPTRANRGIRRGK